PPILMVTEDTPPLLAWLLPLLIMAVAAAGLTWSVKGELDIVVPAQGTLVPSGKVKVIQAPEQRVVRRILVAEGQRVSAGDELVEFDTTDAAADRDRTAKELAAARLRAARLRAGLDGAGTFEPPSDADRAAVADESRLFAADRDRIAGEVASLRQEHGRLLAAADTITASIDKLEAVLPLIRQRVEARRQLVERQIVSTTEFLTLQQELVTAEADLRIQRANLREAEASAATAAERIGQAERVHRMEQAAALVETETRAASLAEDLTKAGQRLRALSLRAPEDGTVHELALHTAGGVVQAAQAMMKLVPVGAVLEVEAKVLNRDVGFLEVGQPVQIKLDTFAFTKYGALPGRVAAISSDAVVDERLGAVYRVRVELERQTMPVDGRLVTLAPGLTATVDVRTGTRRVIDYLLMPILKHTGEAMRER
ncbi:HlyD family type I secretion periplasmic adaptor subunit, partial [Azospirillum sp. TSO22-1]|uniref:HlyD family type I secretion periplasmic adaptor subunit n=1 Tax=Azospirillum sp. TSO22-1 TaxID=716789 RepID=UPI000D615F1E